jgi:N-acetyl-anhydromuramyl-L-alanine amidase AmpD
MTNYEIIDVPNFKNYIQQEVSKNKIVIHGTAGGTYTGALQTFISGAKGVSTHFIISEDAKIYRLFP